MATYLDYYNNHFGTKIKEIDLFLKADQSNGITTDIISELLSISHDEIEHLIDVYKIEKIDAVSFFHFMQNGSSDLCKLFSRELQRKMPHFYSFYDVSYIYQIPYDHVVAGAQSAQLTNITNENMHALFEHIHMAS